MIKKVVIKNLNTSLPYLALGKIKFYDNFGNVIDSGEVFYNYFFNHLLLPHFLA